MSSPSFCSFFEVNLKSWTYFRMTLEIIESSKDQFFQENRMRSGSHCWSRLFFIVWYLVDIVPCHICLYVQWFLNKCWLPNKESSSWYSLNSSSIFLRYVQFYKLHFFYFLFSSYVSFFVNCILLVTCLKKLVCSLRLFVQKGRVGLINASFRGYRQWTQKRANTW